MASSCGVAWAQAVLKDPKAELWSPLQPGHTDSHPLFYSQYKEDICCPWAEETL